jgi:MFS family permease
LSPVRRAAEDTFGSLRVRNYRIFLAGQLVSLSGTWMQTVALGWLVLELGGSGFDVGLNYALQFLPILFAGMWGGVIADHFDKRRILIGTQSTMALIAVGLWGVTGSSLATLPIVHAFSFAIGWVTALDNPTRQSFVTEMVGRDHIVNAVGLNSAAFNASRIFGPALAGIVIATVGLPWAFLINGVSYLAVIYGLYAMDPDRLHREHAPRERGTVRAGLRYVWRTSQLRYTVLMVAVVATFGFNLNVILPLVARFVFDRGVDTYATLTAVTAAGALMGALIGASRKEPTRRLLVASAGAFGGLLVAAAAAPTLPVFVALLFATGAASITFIATANSRLQLAAAPSMRGRVMALNGLVFLGSTPLGGPLLGWIAEAWGPRAALGVSGGITLGAAIAAVIFIRRDAIGERLRALSIVQRAQLLRQPEGPPEAMDGAPDERRSA